MFKKIKQQKTSAGFIYALIPTVFLTIAEIFYIFKAFTGSSGGDSGGGVISLAALFFLSTALAIGLSLLYAILIKNIVGLILALPIVTIEWIILLSVIFNYLKNFSHSIQETYTIVSISIAIFLSFFIYSYEIIIARRKHISK